MDALLSSKANLLLNELSTSSATAETLSVFKSTVFLTEKTSKTVFSPECVQKTYAVLLTALLDVLKVSPEACICSLEIQNE
jgi:hypothetical protein